MKKLFLLVSWGDVYPEIYGPYEDDAERLKDAVRIKEENGDRHGTFALDLDLETDDISTFSFSGAELEASNEGQ